MIIWHLDLEDFDLRYLLRSDRTAEVGATPEGRGSYGLFGFRVQGLGLTV